jgi:hypothetical protein
METQLNFDYYTPLKDKNEEDNYMKEISKDALQEVLFLLKEILTVSKWISSQDIDNLELGG